MQTDQHKQILAYLRGELNEDARQAFEEACRQDAELRQLLQEELQLRYLLQQTAKQSYTQAQKPITSPTQFSRLSRFAVAASVILLASIAIYIWYPSTASNDELYTEYFSTPQIVQLREGSGAPDTLLTAAKTAYINERWLETVDLLVQYTEDKRSSQDPQALLLLGVACMKMQQYKEAIVAFDRISAPLHPHFFDARWYTALAYLQMGDQANTLAQLRQLEASKVYQKRAKDLTQTLLNSAN